MKENFTIIALGSNLGDRLGNLSAGLKRLKNNINVIECSYIYSSKAHLPEGSPREWDKEFYNCVFYGKTSLDSFQLLQYCKDIEVEIGKKSKDSWCPRYLDIDIIAFNNEVIKDHDLTIPHPLMHQRSFVVVPLCDILPEWVHPVLNLKALELANKGSFEGLIKTKFKP